MAGLIAKRVGTTITIRLEGFSLDVSGTVTPVTSLAQVDELVWELLDSADVVLASGTPVHLADEPGTWWASTNLPDDPQVVTAQVRARSGTVEKAWSTQIRVKAS